MIKTDKRVTAFESNTSRKDNNMESLEQLETTRYYDIVARYSHPEVKDEWINRVLANPYRSEVQQNDGRIRYYGYIEEAGKWLRVITEDGKLHNRFFDHHELKRWGKL